MDAVTSSRHSSIVTIPQWSSKFSLYSDGERWPRCCGQDPQRSTECGENFGMNRTRFRACIPFVSFKNTNHIFNYLMFFLQECFTRIKSRRKWDLTSGIGIRNWPETGFGKKEKLLIVCASNWIYPAWRPVIYTPLPYSHLHRPLTDHHFLPFPTARPQRLTHHSFPYPDGPAVCT